MDIIHCSHCNEENPREARFCIECGTLLTAPAAIGATVRLPSNICTHCGSNSPVDARFCVICGHNFQPGTPKAHQTSIPASQQIDQRSAQQSYGSRQHIPMQAQPIQRPHVAPRPIAPTPQPQPGFLPFIPFIFLAGLAFLFMRGMMWPGFFVLIGITALLQAVCSGNSSRQLVRLAFIGLAFFLMFGLKLWFPGIMLLIFSNSILSHLGHSRRSYP